MQFVFFFLSCALFTLAAQADWQHYTAEDVKSSSTINPVGDALDELIIKTVAIQRKNVDISSDEILDNFIIVCAKTGGVPTKPVQIPTECKVERTQDPYFNTFTKVTCSKPKVELLCERSP